MKAYPGSSELEITEARYEGDSSTKEPTLISEVAGSGRMGRAFGGMYPDAPIVTAPIEEATTAQMTMPRPLVYFPDRRARQDAFVSLQSWEGTVMSVSGECFVARLVDRSGKTHDEEGEFPMADVSDDDRELIQEGAVFYWNIGYIIKPSGQRIRASIIRFRRLPAWTRADLDSAKQAAERLADLVGWR